MTQQSTSAWWRAWRPASGRWTISRRASCASCSAAAARHVTPLPALRSLAALLFAVCTGLHLRLGWMLSANRMTDVVAIRAPMSACRAQHKASKHSLGHTL